MQVYTYEEAFEASLKYFNGDELAAKVVVDKYLLKDNNQNLLEKDPNDIHRRIAKEFARIESKKFKNPLTEEEIYEALKGFKRIVPQGSPLFGIGNPYQIVSLSNCFISGTQVHTKQGVKNIEEVIIGDEVITHNGTFEKVEQVHKNTLNNRCLYDVKCYRTPKITVTGNHKLLSISKEQIKWGQKPTWNEVSYLRSGDYIALPHRAKIANSNFCFDLSDIFDSEFINNDVKYNYICSDNKATLVTNYKIMSKEKKYFNRTINSIWSVDEDFSYFLGLWYGDGCVFSDRKTLGIRDKKTIKDSKKNKVRGITFTINSDEKEIEKFIVNYGHKLFGINPDVNYNVNIDGSTQIVFNSTLLGLAFERLFGRRCNGKTLNSQINSWDINLVKKLIRGFIDSDGCITKDGGLRIVINNVNLIKSFYHLLRSFGIPVGITIGVGKNSYARLDFPQHCEYIKNSLKVYQDDRIYKNSTTKFPNRCIEIDNIIFIPIDSKDIHSNNNIEYVYTLGVNNHHSYSVEGLICQNCFVLETPSDSYGGILKTDEQLTQVSKRRGGVGIDISNIRPINAPTANSSRTSTGIIPFMERYSNSIREVGQSSRRGALLLTISVHHPQVLDFASVKKDLTKVTGANISIKLTDEFLNAVRDNKDYEQRWPIDSPIPKISNKVSARKVWNEIITCARNTAEPGLLFWDNILTESPAECYKSEGFGNESCNPCGELNLCEYDSCRLLLLNLFSYVDDPFTKNSSFNFDRFFEDAKLAQRLMDDLIDLELESIDKIINKVFHDPESINTKDREMSLWENIRQKCVQGRRTGTGITALGDAIAALGTQYGSKSSIELTDKIYKTLKLGCYTSSVEMAKEIGAFPIFDSTKELNNPFLLRIKKEDPKLYEDMQKYGRRNIGLLTTAPAGTVSLLTQTSSGIEPVFQLSYIRRRKINHDSKTTKVDFKDQNGDCWEENEVLHPKLALWMEITGEKDIKKSPWYGCCAEDLNWKRRVELQSNAQKHVDHSISSTLNLPEDVSVEKVKEIYETAWELGLKGITVYRKNCRTGVLVDKKTESFNKRPEDLPCDIYHIKIKNKEFFTVIGIKDGKPYEVFAGINGFVDSSAKKGTISKIKRGHYEVTSDSGKVLIKDTDKVLEEEEGTITRLVSTLLRHDVQIHHIVSQLERVEGDFQSFSKCIARVLKKYIKDGEKVTGQSCLSCGSTDLSYSSGCVSCTACGWSKCG